MLDAIAQANLVAGIMAVLTYIAAAPALPLQDANLYAIDQWLGLDWRAYPAFINDRPVMASLLAKSYGMIACWLQRRSAGGIILSMFWPALPSPFLPSWPRGRLAGLRNPLPGRPRAVRQ